jgi:hypothetical protein
MNAYKRLLLAGAAIAALGGTAASAADRIGTAAAVRNKATGTLGGQTRALSSGTGIFQQERIDTARASTAQLLFNDETSLTIGPQSSVKLDEFVYDPNRNAGKTVLNVTKGAFRFITGSADPRSYQIKTPVGTMGVRGTIVECVALKFGSWLCLLFEGEAVFTPANGGPPVRINKPYSYIIIHPGGRVEGPETWTGSIRYIDRSYTIPLYGDQWAGDPNPRIPPTYDPREINRAVTGPEHIENDVRTNIRIPGYK